MGGRRTGWRDDEELWLEEAAAGLSLSTINSRARAPCVLDWLVSPLSLGSVEGDHTE